MTINRECDPNKPLMPVIFVKDDHGLTAVFPFEPGTNDPEMMPCFSLADGHTTAHQDWVSTQELATFQESNEMFRRLKVSYKYNLMDLADEEGTRTLSDILTGATFVRAEKIRTQGNGDPCYCDFGHECEVTRRLPLGTGEGAGNAILCHDHYIYDMTLRYPNDTRGFPAWDSLDLYPEPDSD